MKIKVIFEMKSRRGRKARDGKGIECKVDSLTDCTKSEATTANRENKRRT